MKPKSFPSQRNSRIELLRILCMLMIVAYHYSTYGFYSDELMYSPNKSLAELLTLGGETGVSVFVLISGYYMIDSRYSFRKFSLYMGQIWFYTLGALMLFLTIFSDSGLVTREMLSMSILPISKGHYWFATSFLVLMLLSPYLNSFIKSAGQKQLLSAIAVLFIIYTLLPTLFEIQLSYSTFSRFLILYLSAGYIKLYHQCSEAGARKHLAIALLLLAFALSWTLSMNYLGQHRGYQALLLYSNALPRNAIFIYFMALELFLCFLSLKPVYSGRVNVIAGLTFGVYLFHDNQLFRAMWQGLFKTSQFTFSSWLPLHALITITAVYLAGSIIELLRQKSVGRLWQRLVDSFFVPCWDRLILWLNEKLKFI